MRKFTLAVTIAAAITPLVALATAQQPAELTWHVAPGGDDAGPGNADKPLATVQRALDELARRRAAGDQHPASIVLHQGIFEISQPLKIGPEHAAAGGGLTIEAAVGARPVVSGGRHIAGWKSNPNGTFSVTLPDVAAGKWNFRELFIGEAPRPRARHPNDGYLRIAAAAPDKRTGFTFEPGDIPRGVKGGAELVFLHDWSVSRVAIKSIDAQEHRLTTADPIGPPSDFFRIDSFEAHPRYYLEDDAALLDAPGEWHLDRSSGVLVYRPLAGETPATLDAVAPRAPALLIVQGTDRTPVRKLQLRGLTFTYAAWSIPAGGYAESQATTHEQRRAPQHDWSLIDAAVSLALAEDCSIVECRVLNVGTGGLSVGSRTHRCRIEGCEIDGTGGNCLMLGETTARSAGGRPWWQAAPQEAASHHEVVNNRIEHGGREALGAVGIWIGLAHDVHVAHNEIHNLPYTGISLGWMWNPTPTPAARNVVEYNHIHHVMQTLSDGGGIYTLGRQSGSRLAHNHIHDVPVNAGRAESNGMFLDEGTTEFTVEGNLIYATDRSPLRFHQAGENLVTKNVLVVPNGQTPTIRYNSTDEKLIRQVENTVVEQSKFDRSRYQAIIDAAGPNSHRR